MIISPLSPNIILNFQILSPIVELVLYFAVTVFSETCDARSLPKISPQIFEMHKKYPLLHPPKSKKTKMYFGEIYKLTAYYLNFTVCKFLFHSPVYLIASQPATCTQSWPETASEGSSSTRTSHAERDRKNNWTARCERNSLWVDWADTRLHWFHTASILVSYCTCCLQLTILLYFIVVTIIQN